jgi:hypothetical protein
MVTSRIEPAQARSGALLRPMPGCGTVQDPPRAAVTTARGGIGPSGGRCGPTLTPNWATAPAALGLRNGRRSSSSAFAAAVARLPRPPAAERERTARSHVLLAGYDTP